MASSGGSSSCSGWIHGRIHPSSMWRRVIQFQNRSSFFRLLTQKIRQFQDSFFFSSISYEWSITHIHRTRSIVFCINYSELCRCIYMFHHSILNSNHAVAFPSTSFFQDGKFHAAIVKNNKKWVGGGDRKQGLPFHSGATTPHTHTHTLGILYTLTH